MQILITGGAGFIGQETTKALLSLGHEVIVFDNMSVQIHGEKKKANEKRIVGDLIIGDVRDLTAVRKAVAANPDVIFHFAAETGTGQSMYQIAPYTDTNIQGTANLLNIILEVKPSNLNRLILSSSRSVYGEGAYRCEEHGIIYPNPRKDEDMIRGDFENKCPVCGRIVSLELTDEHAPMQPHSIYGLTKQVQEQLMFLYGVNYAMPIIALRYQNVFGPGQSLINPYTGILSVFANLAKGREELSVFEDGLESRDFVFIDDVAKANVACLSVDESYSGAINIGTGVSTPVEKIAKEVNLFFENPVPERVTGAFRSGDIRHNKADIGLAKRVLDFSAKIDFSDGLQRFLEWSLLEEKDHSYDFEGSLHELKRDGLLKGG